MRAQLAVQIMKFVDADQPGWVACVFTDAQRRNHTLVDKIPVFTTSDLDSGSQYPQTGVADCQIISRYRDSEGGQLARIDTNKAFGIESTQGLSEFVVLAIQLMESE
jgi:hypothetical protein